MTVLEVKSRVPFPLKKGQKLRALFPLTVIVPIQIMDGKTPLAELIRLSNEQADLGVMKSPSGAASAIIVAMQTGDVISLGRSAEIAVDDVPDDKAAFEQLD